MESGEPRARWCVWAAGVLAGLGACRCAEKAGASLHAAGTDMMEVPIVPESGHKCCLVSSLSRLQSEAPWKEQFWG